MTNYEQHDLGKIMPRMELEQFKTFTVDIVKNGLQSPIILYEGKILDGWNRYNVCVSSSVEARYETYTGTSPASYVLSLNMERRHLTSGQRACVSTEILPFVEAESLKRKQHIDTHTLRGTEPLSSPEDRRSVSKVAKMFKISDKSVQLAKKLKKEAPEIFEKVKSGGYTLNDAKRNMKVREHVIKVEAAKVNPQKQEFNGPFDLVLSDPPWQYNFSSTENREIENHYSTATVQEIVTHKPNASNDSILFLWATAPKLLEAIEVMKAWGFEYKTHAIWDKEIIGMGYWFRGQHELLLVGTKGTPGCPIETERISSVIREKRTVHSKKPLAVYEWIEKTFPEKTKLEMYCREARKGWSVWGNEI